MSKIIRSIAVKISMDISDFEKKLDRVTRQMKRTGDNMSNIGQQLSMTVTAPILAVGAAVSKMAMDTIESENLFRESMGNMADDARAWSEGLNKSLGLNSYEVRKNVGMFNVMLQSMKLGEQNAYSMAKGLTQLSYDMASFYNLKPEEAMQKLQSGISGEVEPLKRLGIIVNETTTKMYALQHGIIKQGDEMSENQKVLARYGAILEATQKAQGDMARTISSPTNQLRIMGERAKKTAIDFGMALMPAIQKVIAVAGALVPYIQDLVDKFKNLSTPAQTTIVLITGLAAGIGPLIFILGQLVTSISAVIGVIKLAVGALNPWIIGIGVVVGALAYLYNTNEAVKTGIDTAWNFLSVKLPQYVKDITTAISDFDTQLYESGLRSAAAFGRGFQEQMESFARWARNNETLQKIFNPLGKGKEKEGYFEGKIYGLDDKSIDAAVEKYKETKKKLNESGSGITNFIQDLYNKLKIDAPKINLDEFLKGYKFDINEYLKGLDNMDALKDQTEKTLNGFVGIFERFEKKTLSPERLMNRLKGQVDVIKKWQVSLQELKNRGASETLIDELRKMGPSYAGEVMSISKMSQSQLAEYERLFGARTSAAKGDTILQFNITGNDFRNDDNVQEVADEIIRRIQAEGVTP